MTIESGSDAPAARLSAPERARFAWIDLRGVPGDSHAGLVQAAANHGLDGVVSDDLSILEDVPPTLRRVWLALDAPDTNDGRHDSADVVLTRGRPLHSGALPGADVGAFVDVHDSGSLAEACDAARILPWTVITFADPTKIPLEIVLATADNATGRTVTAVADVEEAATVFDVLEHGSDGVLLAPRSPNDVIALAELCRESLEPLALTEFTVDRIEHVGAGDRACVDTCALLEKDEGVLVGSFSSALLLACSETHPLPYMPTRPFRVNAGAVQSYLLSGPERTNYLSELRAGSSVLAVRTDGTTRRVVIGRIKIERRPLLAIHARGPGGEAATLIVQDDWHVRMLGPGGAVHNVTELKAGDKLTGYLPPQARHVGIPVDEFCVEQ